MGLGDRWVNKEFQEKLKRKKQNQNQLQRERWWHKSKFLKPSDLNADWNEEKIPHKSSKETINVEAYSVVFFSHGLRRCKTVWAHPKCQPSIHHATHSWETCTVWWMEFRKIQWYLPDGMPGAVRGRSCGREKGCPIWMPFAPLASTAF